MYVSEASKLRYGSTPVVYSINIYTTTLLLLLWARRIITLVEEPTPDINCSLTYVVVAVVLTPEIEKKN